MKLTIYQIDRNVRNLYLIPLWGEFMGEPCENVLTDVPFGCLAVRKYQTNAKSILEYVITHVTIQLC
jgi:hypothetical protein